MIDDIRAEEERNSRIVFDYQNQRRSTGVKNQINDERSRRDAHYRLFHWLTIATDCNWLKLKSFLVESWIGCQCFANLAAVDWFAQVSYRSRGPKCGRSTFNFLTSQLSSGSPDACEELMSLEDQLRQWSMQYFNQLQATVHQNSKFPFFSLSCSSFK